MTTVSFFLFITQHQEIELNKAQWNSLFEPYLFFESYKNYLQVDIVAADVDDLRAWKGWVESRLRQLTLMVFSTTFIGFLCNAYVVRDCNTTKQILMKEFFPPSSIFVFLKHLQIERDTIGKLQCHPYPHEYIDATKQCAHCAFFMGLQRKQGETIQEGQQFDIRGSVDEFRHSINMYMFWKPGMEIYVSHVRKRQIPSYVFPDGYRRPRPSRLITPKTDKPSENERSQNDSGRHYLKQKKGTEVLDNKVGSPEEQQSIGPQQHSSISPEILDHRISGVSTGLKRTRDSDALNDKLGTPEKQQCTSPQQDSSISFESSVHSLSCVSPQQHNSMSTNTVSTDHLPSIMEIAVETNMAHHADTLREASSGTDYVKKGVLRLIETDKSSNVELAVSETETGCTSNSSVITNVTSEGTSCEDVGSETVTVTGSPEGSVQDSNDPEFVRGDSCEADFEQLLQNGFVNGNMVFKDGSQETSEVFYLSFLPILFGLIIFLFPFHCFWYV